MTQTRQPPAAVELAKAVVIAARLAARKDGQPINRMGNEMTAFANSERFSHGVRLTQEDEAIWDFDLDLSHFDEYEYVIADRNDAAVMLALTTLSANGCRATKNRLLAGI